MVVKKLKEKCKDAARVRREKERAEFGELSKLLPLPASTTSQLDKASIIRLTSSYLKMRAAFPEGLGQNWGYHDKSSQQNNTQNNSQTADFNHIAAIGRDANKQFGHSPIRELGSLILQTLDGFVFALHSDGKIMYISETASVHLGLPQIDLTGSSIFEFVHPSDHNDILEVLGLNDADKQHLERVSSSSKSHELGRSFCMRMKCILPKRNAGLVNSGYKAIHCNGYLKVRCKPMQDTGINSNLLDTNNEMVGSASGDVWESYALVAVGHSLLPTASTEVKLSGNSFMFRANLDLKIFFIESVATNLLGFEAAEITGQSLYQFIHVEDIRSLEISHKSLIEKGQVVTKYYRVMRKNGGYIWCQSYATLVNNPRNMPKPQHIVSVCFVLGEDYMDASGICSYKGVICSNEMESTSLVSEASILESSHSDLSNHSVAPKTNLRCSYATESPPAGKRMRKSKPEQAQSTPLTQIDQSENQQQSQYFEENSHYHYYDLHPHECKIQLLDPNGSQACTCSSARELTVPEQLTSSIGSTRRSSEDTCSVISSVISTSVSSNSSCSSSTSSKISGQINEFQGSSINCHSTSSCQYQLPSIIRVSPYMIESPTNSNPEFVDPQLARRFHCEESEVSTIEQHGLHPPTITGCFVPTTSNLSVWMKSTSDGPAATTCLRRETMCSSDCFFDSVHGGWQMIHPNQISVPNHEQTYTIDSHHHGASAANYEQCSMYNDYTIFQ